MMVRDVYLSSVFFSLGVSEQRDFYEGLCPWKQQKKKAYWGQYSKVKPKKKKEKEGKERKKRKTKSIDLWLLFMY